MTDPLAPRPTPLGVAVKLVVDVAVGLLTACAWVEDVVTGRRR